MATVTSTWTLLTRMFPLLQRFDEEKNDQEHRKTTLLAVLIGSHLVQAVLTLIVLGLSAGIYRGINSDSDVSRPIRQMGGLQAAIGFCAFAATWGLVNVFIRMVTTPTQVVGLVSEALATLFFFAGAVRLAVLSTNSPCPKKNGYCAQLRADNAFLFICFIIDAAALGLSCMLAKEARLHFQDEGGQSARQADQIRPYMRATQGC